MLYRRPRVCGKRRRGSKIEAFSGRVVMLLRTGALFICAAMLTAGAQLGAHSAPRIPYRPVQGLAEGGGPSVPGGAWARLPGGREMGPPASVHVDIDGESIWAAIRCDETSPLPVAAGGRFGIDFLGPDNRIKKIDTIFRFQPHGKR